MLLLKKNYEDFKIVLNAGLVKDSLKKKISKGKYRGSAHKNCNLNLSLTKKVPFVFRNFQNYDSHLIFQELGSNDFKINGYQKQ